MQVRQKAVTYRTYKRGYLTFYVTDSHKIYFTTNLQKFVLVHSDGIFYKDSNKLSAVARHIRGGSVKDINSLAHSCLEEGVIWQSINRLPL